MPQELSNEIISAEIVFSPQNDISKLSVLPDDQYRQELAVINEKLNKYTNHADRYDYMVAVASGILCGVLDAQIADISKRVLNSKELDLKGKGKAFLNALPKQFEKTQGKTSMAGMFGTVLNSCMGKKAGDLVTDNEETGKKEFDTSKAMGLFGSAAMTAMLKWLSAKRKPKEIDESDFPDTIKTMLHQLNDHPKVQDFLKNPKIPELTPKKLEEVGVPVLFISLAEPYLGDVNKKIRKVKRLPKITLKNWTSKLSPIPIDMNLLGKLGNQAVGVLANELIVRGFYFIRHLMMEMDHCGDIELVDWNKVIPFDNKTVVRMLSISSLTFTAADMSISAVRAAVESGMNPVLFRAKYFTNINVIGVGRAVVAVARDVSMEWEEADLIRERRLLTEKVSAEQVEAILSYRQQMEKVVEEYLAEDLEAFLTGADEIEEGIEGNDSDLVIHGNVTIQRVLGRKPQFTNQSEFDDLMDSMDALVL